MTEQATTTGVQELIDKLSQEGVSEGQRQAEKLVSDAERKSDGILESARQQANDILQRAREDAAQFQSAGEEALRLAARDAMRDFGAKIHDGLRNRLQQLLQYQMQDPQLIRQMILEIARQATADLGDESADLLIPPEIITEEEAKRRVESGDPDQLIDFMRGLLGEDLREGFTVKLGNQRQTGLIVRVVNQNVELDLTDETISTLLLQHLLPRFRAIMRKSSSN